MVQELYSTSLFNDANLQSYWRLEGNSNDAKGAINGTDTSIVYSASYGKFNQGILVNTSTGNINLGNNYNMTASTTFSINAWFKTTATDAAYRVVLSKGNYTDNGFNIVVYASGDPSYANKLGIGVGAGVVISSSALAGDGLWHMVTLIQNGPGTLLTAYIDGVSIGTNTPTYGTNTSPLGIGNQYDNTGAAWLSRGFINGFIDDVSIFNRVLTATEISSLYTGKWSSGAMFFSML